MRIIALAIQTIKTTEQYWQLRTLKKPIKNVVLLTVFYKNNLIMMKEILNKEAVEWM